MNIQQQIDNLNQLINITEELIKVYIKLRDATKFSNPINSLGYATIILKHQLALEFCITERDRLIKQLNKQ